MYFLSVFITSASFCCVLSISLYNLSKTVYFLSVFCPTLTPTHRDTHCGWLTLNTQSSDGSDLVWYTYTSHSIWELKHTMHRPLLIHRMHMPLLKHTMHTDNVQATLKTHNAHATLKTHNPQAILKIHNPYTTNPYTTLKRIKHTLHMPFLKHTIHRPLTCHS